MWDIYKRREIYLNAKYVINGKYVEKWNDVKNGKRIENKKAANLSVNCFDDPSGNRTRVYGVRGRRLDRLTNGPVNRGDRIRTCDLCVPNAALYQTEPRLVTATVYQRLRYNIMSAEKKQVFFDEKIKKLEIKMGETKKQLTNRLTAF